MKFSLLLHPIYLLFKEHKYSWFGFKKSRFFCSLFCHWLRRIVHGLKIACLYDINFRDSVYMRLHLKLKSQLSITSWGVVIFDFYLFIYLFCSHYLVSMCACLLYDTYTFCFYKILICITKRSYADIVSYLHFLVRGRSFSVSLSVPRACRPLESSIEYVLFAANSDI